MRALNAAALALLARADAGEQIAIVQLVELALEVPQYHSTCGYPLQWAGQTWQATGLSVEPVEDEAGSDGSQIVLSLPAVTGAQLALALVEPVEGRAVRIYDALVDPEDGTVAHAELVWAGTANVPGIEDGAVATIGIVCEHSAMRAFKAKPARYTNDEQQRLHPGDTCMDYDMATDAGPVKWPDAAWYRV